MRCHDRDQDLLLLAHGQLPALRRVLTEAHLRRCPRCQECRERFAAVSRLLADTIRGPKLASWSRSTVSTAARRCKERVRWAAAFSLALLLATASVAAFLYRAGVLAPAPPAPEEPSLCGAAPGCGKLPDCPPKNQSLSAR